MKKKMIDKRYSDGCFNIHYLYSGCRSLNFKYTYPLKITKLKFYQNLSGVFCDNNVKTCTPDNRRTTKDNDRSICDSNDLENEL